MSKAVRWQVPFCSLGGVQYRVDIYDEGYAGEPVQLQGGISPIVTDEDNSDDVFEPVRTQSGTLNVLDSGSLMFDIIPQNNTARPVRLVRLSDSAVMWQGFLSCEAYSQPFDGRVKELSLSLISSIAASDSVYMPNGTASRLITIREAIAVALQAISAKMNDNLYGYVHFPKASEALLTHYIDMTAFYDTEEKANEHTHTYELRGQSCKQLLETICRFAGWTLREYGRDIYLTEPTAAIGMKRMTYAVFVGGQSVTASEDYATNTLGGLEYRGTGHTVSVRQGARSVKIEAEVKNYDIAPSLPDTPSGAATVRAFSYDVGEGVKYNYMSICNAVNSYSNIAHHFMRQTYPNTPTASTAADFLANLAQSGAKSESGTGTVSIYGGSFLSKFYHGEYTALPTLDDCLIVWPTAYQGGTGRGSFDSLFDMETTVPLRGMTGAYLCIKPKVKNCLQTDGTVFEYAAQSDDEYIETVFRLQYGNEYWNGTDWCSDSSAYFTIRISPNGVISNWSESMGVSEEDGVFVPIYNDQRGVMKLSMLNKPINYTPYYAISAIVFSDLSVELALPYDASAENGTNHYYQSLNNGYSEDVEVSLGMATILDNLPSPSLLMASTTAYADSINYKDADGNTTAQRPEKNLLARIAAYYGSSRKILSVEVARPDYFAKKIPLLKILNGSTVYHPLAESMDWQRDICTLKCFEI